MTPHIDIEDRDPRGEEDEIVVDDGSEIATEPSLQDWIEADNSRPTLPDETADGLDDMDEEVRRQAEDLPLDISRR